MDDPKTWNTGYNEDTGWSGIHLLHMAGLYNVWQSEDTIIYSYAVITMDSNATFDWLHHRMPAVLDSGEKIKVLSRCIYYTIHVAYLCSTKVNLQNYTCKSKY